MDRYPDGSWYSYVSNMRAGKMSKTWEIHYPDGKVIKKDKDDKVYIGNGFYVALQDGSGADDFIKLLKFRKCWRTCII